MTWALLLVASLWGMATISFVERNFALAFALYLGFAYLASFIIGYAGMFMGAAYAWVTVRSMRAKNEDDLSKNRRAFEWITVIASFFLLFAVIEWLV